MGSCRWKYSLFPALHMCSQRQKTVCLFTLTLLKQREKSLAPAPKIKTHYLTWRLVRKRLLKMFSVGNWERYPEIPMLWKWKRTSEHLGNCLHSSITSGG